MRRTGDGESNPGFERQRRLRQARPVALSRQLAAAIRRRNVLVRHDDEDDVARLNVLLELVDILQVIHAVETRRDPRVCGSCIR